MVQESENVPPREDNNITS